MPATLKAFLVRLPADLHRRLKVLAAKSGQPMSDLVEAAVRDLLKRKGS